MNEQGLILKLIDYKDADKLASVFTFNSGVILAKFVGVKKEKAKLKATAQPFTFADFTFTERAGNRVVSGANIIDNFYPILTDYNKTICGYIILDIIKSLLPEEKPEQDLFLLTISALKNIENGNEFSATIDFILKFLNFSGFMLNLPETDYIYLDKLTGEFNEKSTPTSAQIDKNVYRALKIIANRDLDNTNDKIIEENEICKETTLKQTLRLLRNIIYIHFGVEIKSFDFI